ncbi:hypothetical protein [Phytohabitans rumicis]|nr:hypothetical protein [Phytohabitans rumicis]
MAQPSDKPTTKRAADLRDGDQIIVDSEWSDGPTVTEVRGVEPSAAHRGEFVVLVTGGDIFRWPAENPIKLATEEQARKAEQERERVANIEALSSFVTWLYNHPEAPAPNTMSAQASLFGPWLDQLDIAQRVAESLGVEIERGRGYDGRPTAKVETKFGDIRYVVYGSDDRRDVERRCEHCGEDLDLIEAGRLGHVPGEACDPAPALGGETPLDSLPEDFGADHKPEPDCCEDCDAELDADAEADAADDANTRAGVA